MLRRLRFSSYVPPAGAPFYSLSSSSSSKANASQPFSALVLFQESGHLVTARQSNVSCFSYSIMPDPAEQPSIAGMGNLPVFVSGAFLPSEVSPRLSNFLIDDDESAHLNS